MYVCLYMIMLMQWTTKSSKNTKPKKDGIQKIGRIFNSKIDLVDWDPLSIQNLKFK